MMGSGGGRAPISCKFGVQCHRQDCWYSHPEGRLIDAGGGVAGGGAGNGHAGGRGGGGGLGSRGATPLRSMAGAQASPRMGGGGGGGRTECRYGFDCTRRDCHFHHPYGRAIEGGDVGSGGGGGAGGAGLGVGGARPTLHRHASNSSIGSIGSLSRGMSELSFGSYAPANMTDDEQDLRDTWFPKARDCTCCKGFVYGCTSDICESMGQCTCSIEESDLKGGDSIWSSANGMDDLPSSPHTSGHNGGGKHPPQPPTEAALAAASPRALSTAPPVAAGGGAGPGVGRSGGGGTECRYGVRCTRADCSFRHPQGRHMDRDGVTFGDFGTGGVDGRRGNGGSGGGRGGGKPVVDQDLMDTWYPDCRECTCCKGYKHGCKTPSCAEAGICFCSAAGATMAPVAQAPSAPTPEDMSKPPATQGDGAETSSGAGGAGGGEGKSGSGEATAPEAVATT